MPAFPNTKRPISNQYIVIKQHNHISPYFFGRALAEHCLTSDTNKYVK